MQTTQRANQNSKQIHTTGVKREKTRAARARLVLVWIPIGWESGASFVNQSERSNAKPNQTRNYFRHSIEKRSVRKRNGTSWTIPNVYDKRRDGAVCGIYYKPIWVGFAGRRIVCRKLRSGATFATFLYPLIWSFAKTPAFPVSRLPREWFTKRYGNGAWCRETAGIETISRDCHHFSGYSGFGLFSSTYPACPWEQKQTKTLTSTHLCDASRRW